MLDLRRLAILREIERHGSISAAADALHFTQPAVSRQISRLEAEIGTEVLARTSHGVELTDAGRLLIRHAEGLLAGVARAEEELGAHLRARGQRVRLGFFPTAAPLVRDAARALREEVPGVELVVYEGEPDVTLDWLVRGTVDLALVFEDGLTPAPDAAGLERMALFADPMLACLPAHHPAASSAELRIEDLAHEPWGQGTSDAHPCSVILNRAFAAAGHEPRMAFRSDDYRAVQELVSAGIGLGLVPRLAAAPRDDLVFRPLVPARARQVDLLLVRQSRRPASLQTLADVLSGTAAAHTSGDHAST